MSKKVPAAILARDAAQFLAEMVNRFVHVLFAVEKNVVAELKCAHRCTQRLIRALDRG